MFQPRINITIERQSTHSDKHKDTPAQQPARVSSFFPPKRGVVEFLADDGSTILLAATGNIRDFVAQRLAEDRQQSPRADLSPVTARVQAQTTGSAFESDLILLEHARNADPKLHADITRRNRCAMLTLNTRETVWSVRETTDPPPEPHELAIAPCMTQKAARALAEALDDAYELCRYPEQLARAPHGTPCAYKDMGRCPAACDGSEPLEDYRERFSSAMLAARDGIDAWRQQTREAITHASAELDFETAARLKRRLDSIDALPREHLLHARALDTLTCVIVTPEQRDGWALCWVFSAEGCVPICSIQTLDNELLESLPKLLAKRCTPVGAAPQQLERLALVSRYWFAKPARQRKRRVTVLNPHDPEWTRKLRKAIEHAQSPSADDDLRPRTTPDADDPTLFPG